MLKEYFTIGKMNIYLNWVTCVVEMWNLFRNWLLLGREKRENVFLAHVDERHQIPECTCFAALASTPKPRLPFTDRQWDDQLNKCVLLSFQPYTRKNVSPWLKWCYTFKTCFFLATADTLSGLLSADWLIAPEWTELCPWQRSAMHGNGVLSLATVCYQEITDRILH